MYWAVKPGRVTFVRCVDDGYHGGVGQDLLYYWFLIRVHELNQEERDLRMMVRTPTITLLSETDVYGTISFANDAFCIISKYSRSELIGKPHNIVRHPDMPKALFALCWDTILHGSVFKAVIKNKASDGSHYWVNATIMGVPGMSNDIAKFIGVRHLITDEQLAMKLYDAQLKSFNLRS
jgi:PAS domain S-box-containing protein